MCRGIGFGIPWRGVLDRARFVWERKRVRDREHVVLVEAEERAGHRHAAWCVPTMFYDLKDRQTLNLLTNPVT